MDLVVHEHSSERQHLFPSSFDKFQRNSLCWPIVDCRTTCFESCSVLRNDFDTDSSIGGRMTLYSIDGQGRTRKITYIPHEAEFEMWRSRLTTDQIAAIHQRLHALIDRDKIHTAGWMPGNDWTGTVWEPIYKTACRGDVHASGLCFGLFVWEVMRDHPDAWSFGRYEKDGIPIRSLTYFRISRP